MGVKCEIKFEQNPHGVFYAGQVMSGAVQIAMDRARKFKGGLFHDILVYFVYLMIISRLWWWFSLLLSSSVPNHDHPELSFFFYRMLDPSIRCSIDCVEPNNTKMSHIHPQFRFHPQASI